MRPRAMVACLGLVPVGALAQGLAQSQCNSVAGPVAVLDAGLAAPTQPGDWLVVAADVGPGHASVTVTDDAQDTFIPLLTQADAGFALQLWFSPAVTGGATEVFATLNPPVKAGLIVADYAGMGGPGPQSSGAVSGSGTVATVTPALPPSPPALVAVVAAAGPLFAFQGASLPFTSRRECFGDVLADDLVALGDANPNFSTTANNGTGGPWEVAYVVLEVNPAFDAGPRSPGAGAGDAGSGPDGGAGADGGAPFLFADLGCGCGLGPGGALAALAAAALLSRAARRRD